MAAPEGNQFWKIRSKHGRDKLFATPELLWEAATEYFEWCDANPWKKVEFKGADIVRVEVPTSRPYTMQAFCLYCDTDRSWWKKFKANPNNKDFFPVISRIEETIYTQKFEGAVVGAFNANIIARDLGLAEKVETTEGGRLIRRDTDSGEIVIETEHDETEI